MRQIVINCYKFHGREDLLPAFTEDDEKVNQSGSGHSVSSTVGVLKMHTSGNGTTHKIQIQASGSPQIIAASPTGMSGQTSQVCLDHTGYNSDVDVRTQSLLTIIVVTFILFCMVFSCPFVLFLLTLLHACTYFIFLLSRHVHFKFLVNNGKPKTFLCAIYVAHNFVFLSNA